MISRWCAAPEPEVWTYLNPDGTDEEVPFNQHRRCAFERRAGHDHEEHRDCCWGPRETESRDCTCRCHPDPWSREVFPERAEGHR